jgi:hypothetical protein
MARIEPAVSVMQQWAEGLVDIHIPIPAEYGNWAYWYLGYDDPDFRAGEPVTNGMIMKMTDACILRLKELADE